MKLPGFSFHVSRFRFRASSRPRREQGLAVIVVLALIVLVLIFLLGNLRTFYALGRELQLLDRQQTRRLQLSSFATSTITSSVANSNSVPKASVPK